MSQLLKGAVPFLVLAALREAELYGYEIAQRIREQTGDVLAPSEGTLYPILHRFEADGLLTADWREGDRGPRRRYYRLTKKGGSALAAYEREWNALEGAVRGRAQERPVGA